MRKQNTLVVAIGLLIFGCHEKPQEQTAEERNEITEPTNRVILSSEIEWEKLNPARGDASPQAGTIFGDRKGDGVATGFLAKFVDGFSSPPHIHNVTYRAFVISGLIHNDDPEAENMWMPAGSFWTQPAGEAHITSAKGDNCIAYVEIDKAPYLVLPIDEAFDNGERPVNIDKRNIVWLDASKSSVVADTKAEVAFLWEKDELSGNVIKLPADGQITIQTEAGTFHAVVITGNATYQMPKSEEVKALDPGSYFTSIGLAEHTLSSSSEDETVVYIRTDGDFNLVQYHIRTGHSQYENSRNINQRKAWRSHCKATHQRDRKRKCSGNCPYT